MTVAIILLALFAILLAGVPVAFALAGLGAALLSLKGMPMVMVGQNLTGALNNFVLLAVPLFLLMSNVLLRGGAGRDLFDAVQSWVGHLPGGLGIATLLSCGIFSAISGSSVATAATVGTVAVPEMERRGYRRDFTVGLLAAGGTLGILIPPSIPLIVYGVITEESIGSLFLAGIGPGILLIVLFSAWAVVAARTMEGGGRSERVDAATRARASLRALPTVLLAVVMLGGIYSGAFTPTEAAAVGAVFAVFITAVVLRSLTLSDFWDVLRATVVTTTVLFLVVIGAKIFGRAITIWRIPAEVSLFVTTYVESAGVFLGLVTAILLVVGLFLEALAMLLIMVPVLFPSVLALGIDPIWFGIFFVMLIEVALITPPVGLNLFVIQAVAKCSLATVVRGVLPFVLLMLVGVALIAIFPEIALFLPFL